MMAYKNNFAVAIRHNGCILRELKDLIYIPFGSEYSVLLKNKNSLKAVVDVEIDGQDVLDGNSIIVPANDSVELKGFMRGSTVRNKFRFIEKTKKISDYRGDRTDDSLVRVEYRFEKQPEPTFYYQKPFGNRTPDWNDDYLHNVQIGTSLKSSSTFTSCCNFVSTEDKGITVEGSETRQDFNRGTTNDLESHSSVITLQLVGREPKKRKLVKKPLTVRAKITCDTCGTKSKSSAKFCRECSTYLR